MSVGDDGEHPGPLFQKIEFVLYIPQILIWLTVSLFTCDVPLSYLLLLRMSRVSIQRKAFADHSTHASGNTQAFCVGGKAFFVSSRVRILDAVFSL